ncbi:hypothetical protein Pmani_008345 [Petrolisthes manimaculis]|uniref:Uncharacterized protein n=1 Tax=Petrolisthes manimaculis TaxID=1843537 RepID=A0AAE1Q6I8_9EUCA|nr:hypothetical protein Pmani_008345 [Petrolisthes manimaculis]
MIIEKSRTPSNDTESDGTHTPPSPRHSPPTPNQVTQTLLSDTTQQVNLVRDRVDMLDIDRKIEIIMSKLETKDSEIDLLSTEIKTAYNTIEQLQNRIVELEQHRCGSEAHQHALGTRSTPLNNCLLLGDTNLRTIIREIDDLCFEAKISPYPTLNRLGAVKLLNTIKRQCPDFHLCSNWEEIKKNINTQTPQRSENKYMGYNNVRPVKREPVQSTGSRGQTSYADIASLRAHGRTTQQHPAHKASHHPSTAPKPRSPSHLTPARTMTRERETAGTTRRVHSDPHC